MKNIIVCTDGYCNRDKVSKICCAQCPDVTTCEDRCKYMNANIELKLCNYQDYIKTEDDLYFFEPNGGTIRFHRLCYNCGESIENEGEYNSYMYDDEHYCETCFHELFCSCGYCGGIERTDSVYYIQSKGYDVCEYCYDEYFDRCRRCSEIYLTSEMMETGEGHNVCESCWIEHYISCDECGATYEREQIRLVELEGLDVCQECWDRKVIGCDDCGREGFLDSSIRMYEGDHLCQECIEIRIEEAEEDGDN